MEFLLKNMGLFAIAFSALLAQIFFMFTAFHISKIFIRAEINKLKEESLYFELGVILFFGIIISTIISFIGTTIVSSLTKLFFVCPSYFYKIYFKLLIVFSVILMSYTVFTNSKNNSDSKTHAVSQSAHKRFMRMIFVSLFITAVTYAIVISLSGTGRGARYAYAMEWAIITYCFTEVCGARDLISKMLSLNKVKTSSISAKIANFLNDKFQYVILFSMIYAAEINRSGLMSNRATLAHINSVYIFPLLVTALQYIIVTIINKFENYIDSLLNDGTRSAHLIKNHGNNITYLCDFIVLAIYFTLICGALKYIGININKYVFNEYFIFIVFGSFITFMLCRAFNEFRDTILEKAAKGDQEHYMRLKTFAPTLSVIFYCVLFITSALIVLSNIGVNVTPIVASFSILSAAFVLASQDIIKAFLHGLTLLLEKNLYVGDYVDINDKSGVIEKLSVRVLYLRAFNGCLHVIPYNLVNSITNHSKGYRRHSEILRLVSQKDVEAASKILENIVEKMKKEPQYDGMILSGAIVHGLEPFDLTGVKIKWEVLTKPKLIHITNDIYRRLIIEFKKKNIKIPEIANNVSVCE